MELKNDNYGLSASVDNLREIKSKFIEQIHLLVDFIKEPEANAAKVAPYVGDIVDLEKGLASVYSRTTTIDIVKDKLCNNLKITATEVTNVIDSIKIKCEGHNTTVKDILNSYINNLDLTTLDSRLKNLSNTESGLKLLNFNIEKVANTELIDFPGIPDVNSFLSKIQKFVNQLKSLTFSIYIYDIDKFTLKEEYINQMLDKAGEDDFIPVKVDPVEVVSISYDLGNNFKHILGDIEVNNTTLEDPLTKIVTIGKELPGAISNIKSKTEEYTSSSNFVLGKDNDILSRTIDKITNKLIVPYTSLKITDKEVIDTLDDANNILESYLNLLLDIFNTMDLMVNKLATVLYGVNRIYGMILEATSTSVTLKSKRKI